MKPRWLVVAFAACSGGSAAPVHPGDEVTVHTSLADDKEPPPPYDKAALQMALIAERAAEAKLEGEVGELEDGDPDKLRIASANLAVRRRFIATLEICETQNRMCPPRLDDPPWPYGADNDADPKLDVELRFDLTSWQKVTAELHGRACACRTLACVDSMDATLGRLETRPTDVVQGDEAASTSIARARECLFRLRGRKQLPRVARD